MHNGVGGGALNNNVGFKQQTRGPGKRLEASLIVKIVLSPLQNAFTAA